MTQYPVEAGWSGSMRKRAQEQETRAIDSFLNHASRLTFKDGEIVLVDCDAGDETDA